MSTLVRSGATAAAPDVFLAKRSGGDRAGLQAAVDAAVASIAATGNSAVVDLGGGIWFLNSATSAQPVGFTGRPVGIKLPVNLAAKLTIRNGTVKLSTGNAEIAFWINQGGGYGTNGATTNSSTTMTCTATNGTFAIGQVIRGTGIADTTKITNVVGTTITLSQAATATGTGVTITSYAYDVFKNVTFEDITVDNNSATGRCSLLVGNRPAANTATRYLSFDTITVRRCRGFGVADDATEATTHKNFVEFTGVHNAVGETPQTYARDILVEDCVMTDTQGGILVNALNGLPSNHYHDNIRIRRCSHKRTTVPTTQLSQTSYFIGGGGLGQYGEVIDCYSENIADDGIEIGALQHVVISGFRCRNAFAEAVLFRHSQAPTDIPTQTLTVRDSYFDTTAALGAVSGAKARAVAFLADDSAYEFGEVRLVRVTQHLTGMTRTNQALSELGITVIGPVRHVEIISCAAHLENYVYDVAPIQDQYLFHTDLNTAAANSVVFRDCSAYVANVTNTGGGTGGSFFGINPRRGTRILIDGFDWRAVSVAGTCVPAAMGYFNNTTVFHAIRNVTGRADSATSTHGIIIYETGTVQAGYVEGCDLRNLFHTGTVDVERTIGGTNSNAISERGITYGLAPTTATLTVGASPYAYRNTTGQRRSISVSGGTVTQIEFGDSAATYTTTGLTSGSFVVDHGSYLRVTYSVAPTMKTFPLS